MHDLIRRIAHWVSLLFPPGTGTHRAGARRACPAHLAAVPNRAAASVAAPSARRPVPLPAHRSPYGLGLDVVVDADAIPLVRPYLVAHEQECVRQQRRRLSLVLAADFGIDLDQHLVGAELAETETVAA